MGLKSYYTAYEPKLRELCSQRCSRTCTCSRYDVAPTFDLILGVQVVFENVIKSGFSVVSVHEWSCSLGRCSRALPSFKEMIGFTSSPKTRQSLCERVSKIHGERWRKRHQHFLAFLTNLDLGDITKCTWGAADIAAGGPVDNTHLRSTHFFRSQRLIR